MSNQSSPPPIPPPYVDERSLRQENSGMRPIWVVLACVLLGLLFGMLVLLVISRGQRPDLGSTIGEPTPSNAETKATDIGRLGAPAEIESTVEVGTLSEEKTPSDAKSYPIESASEPTVANSSNGNDKGSEIELEPKPITVLREYVGSSNAVGSGGIDSEAGVAAFLGNEPAASTVFVIDQSASMEGDSRWERVVISLSKAIHRLSPDQSFTVICFSDTASPYNNPLRLIKATRPNQVKVVKWLKQQDTLSGTNPEVALLQSLELDVARIVLLSDGEFDPSIVDQITSKNQSKTKPSQINCVGLAEQVQTLQDLAKQNRGIYYQAR